MRRAAAPRSNRGFVIWFVLALTAFLFLFMYHVTFLSQGEISQLSRTEKFIRCELATRSIYTEIAAGLKVNPWSERKFRTAPQTITGTFDGVNYTALVENTPGVVRSADIWITAEKDGVKRTVFYRIGIAYSILQKMNVVTPVFFTFADPDKYGSKDRIARLRERVDEVLGSREEKRLDTEKAAAKIQTAKGSDGVLSEMRIGGSGLVKGVPPPAPAAKKGEPAPPPAPPAAPASLGQAFNPVKVSSDLYAAPPKVKQSVPPSKMKIKIKKSMVANVTKQFEKLPPAPAPLKGPIPVSQVFIDNNSVKMIQTIEKKTYGEVRDHGTAVLDANNQVVAIEPTGSGTTGGTNVTPNDDKRPSEDPATTPLGGSTATVAAAQQEAAESGTSDESPSGGSAAASGTADSGATTTTAEPVTQVPIDKIMEEAPKEAIPTSTGEPPVVPPTGIMPIADANQDFNPPKPTEGTGGTVSTGGDSGSSDSGGWSSGGGEATSPSGGEGGNSGGGGGGEDSGGGGGGDSGGGGGGEATPPSGGE